MFEPTKLDLAQGKSFIAARMLAVELAPYLAAAIFRLSPLSVQFLNTVAVDRWWRIYIDFNVFDCWEVNEQALAIVHEVSHLLRDHAQRCEELDANPSIFNIAADAEINDDLHDLQSSATTGNSYQGVPDHWILPSRLHPPSEDGKLAEYYYEHIYREHTQNDPGSLLSPIKTTDHRSEQDGKNVAISAQCKTQDCGSGAGGPERSWELAGDDKTVGAVDSNSAKLIRRRVAQDVFIHQKSQSFVPQGILNWAVKQVEQPSIHWKRILAGKIKRAVSYNTGQVDYSYQRPGRRRIPSIITPSMRHPVPSIAVILDTSASMSNRELSAALAEIQGIAKQIGVRGKNLKLIQVDTDICSVEEVYNVKKIECYGGGGTDLRVGFKTASTLRPKPNVIIVLTDGYTPWPKSPINASVIVGLISDTESTPEIIKSIPAWAATVGICSRSK